MRVLLPVLFCWPKGTDGGSMIKARLPSASGKRVPNTHATVQNIFRDRRNCELSFPGKFRACERASSSLDFRLSIDLSGDPPGDPPPGPPPPDAEPPQVLGAIVSTQKRDSL